jgi:hypothetical protein
MKTIDFRDPNAAPVPQPSPLLVSTRPRWCSMRKRPVHIGWTGLHLGRR